MTEPRTAVKVRRRARLGREGRYGLAFLAPFLVLFTAFQVIPMEYAVWQALHRTFASGLGFGGTTTKFVGLDNFGRVLHDPALRAGVLRMLLFGLVQVPLMLELALVMALLFDSALARLKRLFQFGAFLPYAVPGVIGAILWSFLYLPGISPIVGGLTALQIPHDFLAPGAVLWSIANITTWQWTGYNMLIVFAALQALPRELLEAARVDGASGFQVSMRIKVPLVRPALVLTGVFSIIGTLQLFSEPAIVRTLTGNVTATYTPIMAAYHEAFSSYDANYAAAIAVALALVTFTVSYTFLRVAQRGQRW